MEVRASFPKIHFRKFKSISTEVRLRNYKAGSGVSYSEITRVNVSMYAESNLFLLGCSKLRGKCTFGRRTRQILLAPTPETLFHRTIINAVHFVNQPHLSHDLRHGFMAVPRPIDDQTITLMLLLQSLDHPPQRQQRGPLLTSLLIGQNGFIVNQPLQSLVRRCLEKARQTGTACEKSAQKLHSKDRTGGP